jgi:hypothetical protein
VPWGLRKCLANRAGVLIPSGCRSGRLGKECIPSSWRLRTSHHHMAWAMLRRVGTRIPWDRGCTHPSRREQRCHRRRWLAEHSNQSMHSPPGTHCTDPRDCTGRGHTATRRQGCTPSPTGMRSTGWRRRGSLSRWHKPASVWVSGVRVPLRGEVRLVEKSQLHEFKIIKRQREMTDLQGDDTESFKSPIKAHTSQTVRSRP